MALSQLSACKKMHPAYWLKSIQTLSGAIPRIDGQGDQSSLEKIVGEMKAARSCLLRAIDREFGKSDGTYHRGKVVFECFDYHRVERLCDKVKAIQERQSDEETREMLEKGMHEAVIAQLTIEGAEAEMSGRKRMSNGTTECKEYFLLVVKSLVVKESEMEWEKLCQMEVCGTPWTLDASPVC